MSDGPTRPGVTDPPSATGSLLRRLLRRPAAIAAAVLVVPPTVAGLLAGSIAPGNPKAQAYPTFRPPSGEFLMGTDNEGRAMLAMVVHGLSTSLVTVVSVVAISAVLGVAVGALSGYRGSLVDSLLMRFVDMVQAVPSFFLAIVVLAVLGSGQDKLILLLGLTSWTPLARVVRAQVLSVKRREFVQAARSLGSSGTRTVLRHVLPNVVPAVVVLLPLLASRVVLIEAGLAFLGLGDPNRLSLGYLISNAQPHLRYYWWMSVFPGLVLTSLVLGYNLLGDAFNELLNRSSGGSLLIDRASPARSRRRRSDDATTSIEVSAVLD